MRAGYGRTFVQVLDETIAGLGATTRPSPPAPHTAPAAGFPWGGVQTAPIYGPVGPAFAPGLRAQVTRLGAPWAATPRGGATDASRADAAPAATVTPAPTRAETPRRARRLTSDQQQALSRLVALGATIDAGFTDADLRRASRTLAQRFHPDRHPGAGPHELARLTSLFSDAREACTRLASALTSD